MSTLHGWTGDLPRPSDALRNRILNLLADQPALQVSQIEPLIVIDGFPARSVFPALLWLLDQGSVQRDGWDRYTLHPGWTEP